ncbi:MAG: RecQ family zinc-binding domain-containing protein, partial [Myxococcales bacterium]|nr:RecQ family zinc-binding domain-containing protein [Myxococcales bacterium]
FIADPPPDMSELMERAKQYEARRIADRQRLDALLGYVKAPGCRNQVILQYLGEPEPPKCGRCDNCLRSREAALAASTEATRLGASLTRQLDDDPTETKPRREIKARVVRIDQPQPDLLTAANAAGGIAATAAPRGAGPAPGGEPPKGPSTVLRRSKAAEPPPAAPAPSPSRANGAPTVLRRSSASPPAPAPAAPPVLHSPLGTGTDAVAPAAATDVAKRPSIGRPGDEHPPDEEELDDDELDDDELDDEDDDDEDDDDEDVDDELVDDEDDDDLDDEDDDLDDDDEDDDDDDDDEDDDDDDYEVIDKTAAELAEEGLEGPGEITVLARKKQPKQPKQRAQRVDETGPSASAAEARRRRRRRRRKRRAMLPPKSAFTTPVLSTAAPIPEAQPRRPGGGGGGPVIEYVRGPMRIAMAPVASANPNDAGAGGSRGPRRGKKLRRWERFDRGGNRSFDRGPGGGSGGGGPRPQPQPGTQAQGEGAGGQPGERRRRRRRRRRNNNGQPMQNGQQALPPADGAPVSFFEVRDGNRPQPQGGPPVLGPDGQPLRKRRRRRRRGRGGRQREWRQTGGEGGGGGGGGGPPPSDAGGGPPSEG